MVGSIGSLYPESTGGMGVAEGLRGKEGLLLWGQVFYKKTINPDTWEHLCTLSGHL